MLGRQEPGLAGPLVTYGIPRKRKFRDGRPLSRQPPRPHGSVVLRGQLGHTTVQQQGGLAGGRVTTFRLEFRRPVRKSAPLPLPLPFPLHQICHGMIIPNDGSYVTSRVDIWCSSNRTGYGNHADYVFGWKDDALQRALDSPCYINCPTLATQDVAEMNACHVDKVVDDDIDSCECIFRYKWVIQSC